MSKVRKQRVEAVKAIVKRHKEFHEDSPLKEGVGDSRNIEVRQSMGARTGNRDQRLAGSFDPRVKATTGSRGPAWTT